MMRTIATAFLAVVVLTGDAGAGDAIYDRAGRKVGFTELAARLRAADVVILGEVHDNPAHHAMQARLVRRIAPSGLAFEMIPESAEVAVRRHRAAGGDVAGIATLTGWSRRGWPDFSLYAPIFAAAPRATITGAGVARPDLMAAATRGAAAVVGDPRLAAHLAKPLGSAAGRAIEDEMISAHCAAITRDHARRMVEVQRLRDARLALAALRAKRSRGRVVLITGNGHARRDRGVPVYLGILRPLLRVVVLGQIERSPVVPRPAGVYDFVHITRPAPRKDPCAAFRKRRKR